MNIIGVTKSSLKNYLSKSVKINAVQCRYSKNPSNSKAEFITGITGQCPVGTPAAYFPIRMKIEKGKTYAWCACGLSNKQPFCDGAHKKKNAELKPEDDKFGPIRFTAEKDKTVLFADANQRIIDHFVMEVMFVFLLKKK